MRRSPILAFLLPTLAAILAPAGEARAQDARACTSCEGCSKALAVPGARVELGDDVTAGGEACIVIKGEKAIFDGLDHLIRPKGSLGAGVRVEAKGALVRNAHVVGADVGVIVAGAPEVTLFHDTLEPKRIGVRVEAADGVRITRSLIKGGSVGIAFGAREDGACDAGATLASPAAVVNRTFVDGAGVGIAACDAVPVLTRNTLIHNGVGLILGSPAAGGAKSGPYDPCLCAPELSGLKPGTTIFFTTGCAGCEVHEAWMPDLKRDKHDIRMRESGRENLAIAAKFDAFLDRCAPEVTDVLGIPGCVPNYACLASDVTFKVRAGDDAMAFEAHIESAADVARYADECAAAGKKAAKDGPNCVAHALADNVICASKTVDIRGGGPAKKAGGAGNACGSVDGWADEGASGCASACPSTLPSPPAPVKRAKRAASPDAPPTAAPPGDLPPPPVPPPAPAPTAAASAAPLAIAGPAADPAEASAGGGQPAMVWFLGGAGGLGALFFLSRLFAGKAPALPKKRAGSKRGAKRK
jgi:hypothetical protein